MSLDAQTLLSDPEWLAHRYVESDDSVRFIRVPRQGHGLIPFLTDDCLGGPPSGGDLPASACLTLPADPRMGFLFHSAFCGSTLLTRALDRNGQAMGLSEPVILNDLVGFRRRGAPPASVARLADIATRLLARPFNELETVIVKPSNVVNPLAELLLALRPQAQAVFLYAPLDTFLVSVARKGLPCRLWVRELLEGYLRDGFVSLGFAPEDFFRQSDLQVAAVGWLAQQAYFQRLATKYPERRLRTLDADRMQAQPHLAIEAAAKHFGISLDQSTVAEIVSGPAFNRHSKSGQAFTPESRAREYAAAHETYGAEIDLVLAWAEKVADGAGIKLSGMNPLLD